MKKVVSLVLSVVLVFLLPFTAFAADANSMDDGTTFSYYNEAGEIVTVVITRATNTAISEVYVDGILTQRAVADAATKTIETEVYDLTVATQASILPAERQMNGFSTSIVHSPISNETIAIETTATQARSINDEPVDNTGLPPSEYFDGYCYLGASGGYYYAPEVFGYLYRRYTCTYDGETHYWSWGAGDTLGAISAYIALYGGPVSAVISVLLFAVGEVLMYNQSVELATYTYDYHYRVRVNGPVRFTTQRNITYWRIDNVTEGTTKWEQKRFNYGFSLMNSEMVKVGIDNYLETIS